MLYKSALHMHVIEMILVHDLWMCKQVVNAYKYVVAEMKITFYSSLNFGEIIMQLGLTSLMLLWHVDTKITIDYQK